MAEIIRKATLGNLWFYVITGVALALLVASWFVPPMGAIDESVLKAGSLILGFACLGVVYHSILKGIDAKFTHGQTSIEINNPDK